MLFKEFAEKLSSVLRNGNNTGSFTHSLFEEIVTEEGQNILDDYSLNSYKGFFNGNTRITNISKKINIYVEPMQFSDYIYTYSDAVVENLCKVFADILPDIEPKNAGDKLAELFVSIITEAASTTKKRTSNPAKTISSDLYLSKSLTLPKSLTAELYTNKEINPFQKYLNEATKYYSTKKTLLYAEKPHPFYDLYICNNIQYKNFRIIGTSDSKSIKIISNVTVDKLVLESKYIIIQGIGGIGKSMLLTHLFLSSAKQSDNTGITPLFLSLKDYKDTTNGIIDFIWKSIKEYDSNISQINIVKSLQQKKLILLLDGLDEIQSTVKDLFYQDLETFIKAYSGNTIIMTSRPVYSFVSYSKFSIFDIQEFTKGQAIELVKKLEFWDIKAKNSFLEALNKNLYWTHRQFASNPLLLTIMLMTYSSFGEVPAKMHTFYSKAYETMARLHDASKGSFKRPFHTKLTPEEFAKYFSQFCARTYKDEVLEFNSMLFTAYMKKVLKSATLEHQNITPRDFLLDLTNNLCIMYHEGEQYYFIHRSFQEYFAAVYFASEYDANLYKVGSLFEKMKNRSYTDRTFNMLYDMIPEKIERFVFLPYLKELITACSQYGKEEYWEFLERIYPSLIYEEGNTEEFSYNEAESFLYQCIIQEKNLKVVSDLNNYKWAKQIYDFPTKVWVEAYSEFLKDDTYDKFPDPDSIPEDVLNLISIVPKDELPRKYSSYFGTPEQVGITIEIDIDELRKNPHRYIALRNCMEHPDFPIFREYQNVKQYYEALNKRTQLEIKTDDLFDD